MFTKSQLFSLAFWPPEVQHLITLYTLDELAPELFSRYLVSHFPDLTVWPPRAPNTHCYSLLYAISKPWNAFWPASIWKSIIQASKPCSSFLSLVKLFLTPQRQASAFPPLCIPLSNSSFSSWGRSSPSLANEFSEHSGPVSFGLVVLFPAQYEWMGRWGLGWASMIEQ